MTNDSNPVIEITLPGRDSKRNVSETGLRTEVEADYHSIYQKSKFLELVDCFAAMIKTNL